MNKVVSSTREKIMTAAIYLFNTKGYHGTSVRDISSRANVNVANVSYYFKGKQGLLEECFTRFFEPYLLIIEKVIKKIDEERADRLLLEAIKNILTFQSQHHHLSRLVLREITVDSQVTREICSSYLMKERYYLKLFFEKGIQQGVFSPFPISFAVVHLKSLLSMPFINKQYMEEVWNLYPHDKLFTDRYFLSIQMWINKVLLKSNIVHQEPLSAIVNQ
ncbi:forespore capture DNA-binding protein RefZ [Bacillus spongiae]|uniref:Forespore capture DNA-binding protein RefZ n=1 Tax=Bacillus spongiae TaxID=2683610 RepID=A0ABU8H877_9BACI